MSPGFGSLDVIPSIWGHWAGGPGDSLADVQWLDDHLKRFFAVATGDAASLAAGVKQMVVDDVV